GAAALVPSRGEDDADVAAGTIETSDPTGGDDPEPRHSTTAATTTTTAATIAPPRTAFDERRGADGMASARGVAATGACAADSVQRLALSSARSISPAVG